MRHDERYESCVSATFRESFQLSRLYQLFRSTLAYNEKDPGRAGQGLFAVRNFLWALASGDTWNQRRLVSAGTPPEANPYRDGRVLEDVRQNFIARAGLSLVAR